MPAVVVVFAGRFQPFHAGHFGVYSALVERFGADAVYLASSDRAAGTTGRPAPLPFSDKKRLITGLFDVPADRVVQIKSPYAPREILAAYDPEQTAFVAVIGARDEGRLKSRYWEPFVEGAPLLPYPTRGYILTMPPRAADLSASQIRAALGDPSRPLEAREAAFRALYPRWDAEIFHLLIDRLGAEPGQATSSESP